MGVDVTLDRMNTTTTDKMNKNTTDFINYNKTNTDLTYGSDVSAKQTECFLNGQKFRFKDSSSGCNTIPVVMKVDEETGNVTLLSNGLPPDTLGFNMMKASQLESKNKTIMRLQKKLMEKRSK